jgi:hypothetical protein
VQRQVLAVGAQQAHRHRDVERLLVGLPRCDRMMSKLRLTAS